MSGILQLVEPVETPEKNPVPQFLVNWSSPWEEFVSSIKPALARSEARLAGEAPFGLLPFRIMMPSYVVEAFLIMAVIFIKVKVDELRPYVAPRISSHDVIYYTGDELPRTEDLGGAEAGKAGKVGGDESHHRTQTIKIARGGSFVPQVVDAPNLKLPSSSDAVANLLAVKPNPGPPPAEGLRSKRSAPNLAASVVAPAPNAIRDYTRNGVQLESVIAPAPNVTRDRTMTSPTFSTTLIPPAPSVQNDHTLYAPALVPTVVAPAPRVSRDRTSVAPTLDSSVVAPAPSVANNRSRSAPGLAGSVIPPAPGGVTREISGAPVRMANPSVIPPPVSAPERSSDRTAKLTMPATSVVAPPPSANMSPERARLAGGNVPDPTRTVVPPPPSQSGSGSLVSSLIGKIFGASEVVPPPPSVNTRTANGGSGSNALASNVVPPPPSVAAGNGNARGGQSGSGLSANVVAPPPSTGVHGGTGTGRGSAPYLGNPGIVPPPPSLAGHGGGSGNTGGGNGAAGGALLANNIVPPPPSVGGGSSPTGSGMGRKGVGLGGPNDLGTSVAPPNTAGSGTNAGAVISTQPGSKIGLPNSGGSGSLAMSPSGGDKSGIGGSGGGTGIGHGNGTGSALAGNGVGAGKDGAGRGADPNARGGISMSPGPGGAGNLNSGTPPIRGVNISGGSSVVTLPGFGDDPATTQPTTPGRTNVKQQDTLGVTVVATASSGGAFEPYKNLLRGEKYTTYLDTPAGTVVMEFADENSASHFGGTLTAPVGVRLDLPKDLPRARMVVIGTLDADGNFRISRVLEPGPAQTTAKIVASLNSWKFTPAMRGKNPVSVTAILGFGIDTNDRF